MPPVIGRLRPVAARLVRRRGANDDPADAPPDLHPVDQDAVAATNSAAAASTRTARTAPGTTVAEEPLRGHSHALGAQTHDPEESNHLVGGGGVGGVGVGVGGVGDDGGGGGGGVGDDGDDGLYDGDSYVGNDDNDNSNNDNSNNNNNNHPASSAESSRFQNGARLLPPRRHEPGNADPPLPAPAPQASSAAANAISALPRLPGRLRPRVRAPTLGHGHRPLHAGVRGSKPPPSQSTPLLSAKTAASETEAESPLAPPAASRPTPPALVPRASAGKGRLVFDTEADRKLAERQRASIKFVFHRLSRDLLAGAPNIRTMSMPVHLNEPRSFLQRVVDEFTYADHFLPAAVSAAGNPVLRLSFVAGLLVSGLHRSATMAKVFNPHIGETYQASFGPAEDPTLFSLEQSRHHPPVAHFIASPSDCSYTLSGYSCFDSSIRFSEQALLTRRTGISVVDFADDDSRIVFFQPQFVVRGLMSGERRVDVQGPCSLYYEKYNLVLDLLFDPPQPFVIFGTRLPSERFQGVLYELGDDSSHAFSTAFAKDARAFFGAPDELVAWLTREREQSSGSLLGTMGSKVSSGQGAVNGARTYETNEVPECEDASASREMVYPGEPDVTSPPKQEKAELFVSPAFLKDLDRNPIELRNDREVQNSVISAWQATANGNVADFDGVDESASLPSLSRKIVALASGSFVSHLDIGGLRIWDVDTPTQGVRPMPVDEVLPSDSRFRPDLVALQDALAIDDSTDDGRSDRNAMLEKAQAAKDDLENRKRQESRYRVEVENVHDGFIPKVVLAMGTR